MQSDNRSFDRPTFYKLETLLNLVRNLGAP